MVTESSTEEIAAVEIPKEIEEMINNLNNLFRQKSGASEQDPKTRHAEEGKKITEGFILIAKLEKDPLGPPNYFGKLKASAKAAESRRNNFEKFWNSRGMEFEQI